MKKIRMSEAIKALAAFSTKTEQQQCVISYLQDSHPRLTVPVIPTLFQDIKAAIETEDNALDMERWHSCNSAHCLAGWMVHVVPGREGYKLEAKVGDRWHGTPVAAIAIFIASCPWATELPYFYHAEYEEKYGGVYALKADEVDQLATDYINRMAQEEAAYNKEHRPQ